MKRQLSDEQFDKMMKTLVAEASADDALIDDITASPTLWWNIQRSVRDEKAAAKMPWPPVKTFRRWLMIGVPTIAAVAVVTAIFVFRPALSPTETAGLQQNGLSVVTKVSPTNAPEQALPVTLSTNGDDPELPKTPAKTVAKGTIRRAEARSKNSAVAVEKADIKSEFIALTYARNPESGQLVRVRVPSEMMVTLGLVNSVEKPTSMVDAEVVIGDDGQTHAIRFIR